MKVVAAFALAAWLAFVATSAVRIHGFDSFERGYGKAGTFLAILVLTIPFAIACGLAAGAGRRIAGRGHAPTASTRRLLATSIAFGVIVAAGTLASEMMRLVWLFWILALVAALACGAWLGSRDVPPKNPGSRG